MQESKFLIYGEMIRPNGHQQYDILSYIAETREEAIATCKRLHPHFHIIGIKVDESKPEVVKLQSLIWHFLMRIFLATIVILLGANLLIDLLDSNMVEMIKERNEQLEKAIESM